MLCKICCVFLLEIISIAFALSIDSFAVSAAGGCTRMRIRKRIRSSAALCFAFCQGLLTFIGWIIGENALVLIENFVQIIAFLLLMAIGSKMCYDAIKKDDGKSENFLSPLNIKMLFILGLATSIDALAVGVTLAFTNTNIIFSCAVISIVTFLMSYIGIAVGKTAVRISKRLPIVGGLVLISIAISMLF